MNSRFIRLWEALETMDTVDAQGRPVRFQLKFVTANRQTGEGGEIIELKDATKCSVRTRDGREIFPQRSFSPAATRTEKNPNHWANATRNVRLPNGQKRKLHIRLIIEFNHQKVVY